MIMSTNEVMIKTCCSELSFMPSNSSKRCDCKVWYGHYYSDVENLRFTTEKFTLHHPMLMAVFEVKENYILKEHVIRH